MEGAVSGLTLKASVATFRLLRWQLMQSGDQVPEVGRRACTESDPEPDPAVGTAPRPDARSMAMKLAGASAGAHKKPW
ncbi:MAG: hypothetical protein K2Q97_18430, partial [Burkholderiaceae bacterium]|nr:hypothetical protein [Burkholderiaceae bacterium]